VDVVPEQTSAIWAYGLRWRPEPLLQWYMAYSSELDRVNADAVGERGAERILRSRTGVVDGKVPDFEAPATYLAVLCNYRELAADSSWEVLARTPNRCGSARSLGTVRARSGETVTVPAGSPNELVYATVRFPEPLLDRLQSVVFKPLRLPRVTLDGDSDYRFVPATADGPLVLRTPAAAGLSPLFGGGSSVETLQLRRVPSPYTIEFHALPISGAPWLAPKPARAGRLEPSALTRGERRYRIVPGALSGFVDTARSEGGAGVVTGWAADASTGRPAELVAVFAGNRLIAEVGPALARPDVRAMLGTPGPLELGYALALSPPAGERIRVFAIAGDRASELEYPSGYPWLR
jgi:hypothetical protein